MKKVLPIVAFLACLTLACSLTSIVVEIVGGEEQTAEVVAQEKVGEEVLELTDEPLPSNLIEGLVARFSLNGNGIDSEGGMVSQTYNTSVAVDRLNNSNGALNFNGIDSFVEIQDNDLLDLTGEFTIAFFI